MVWKLADVDKTDCKGDRCFVNDQCYEEQSISQLRRGTLIFVCFLVVPYLVNKPLLFYSYEKEEQFRNSYWVRKPQALVVGDGYHDNTEMLPSLVALCYKQVFFCI